ncbi:hypothetical protein JTE90_021585 [Oedothorax gibbosus]|uniref:Uncharacterized protein n=1 Tax=Oedothorax gibbosus TaxID=931172 RepID=A0AAV6VNT5_9ARAC|nr:hypothetical protein JTE90_021585 [Oedothorax gibbosus]
MAEDRYPQYRRKSLETGGFSARLKAKRKKIGNTKYGDGYGSDEEHKQAYLRLLEWETLQEGDQSVQCKYEILVLPCPHYANSECQCCLAMLLKIFKSNKIFCTHQMSKDVFFTIFNAFGERSKNLDW